MASPGWYTIVCIRQVNAEAAAVAKKKQGVEVQNDGCPPRRFSQGQPGLCRRGIRRKDGRDVEGDLPEAPPLRCQWRRGGGMVQSRVTVSTKKVFPEARPLPRHWGKEG